MVSALNRACVVLALVEDVNVGAGRSAFGTCSLVIHVVVVYLNHGGELNPSRFLSWLVDDEVLPQVESIDFIVGDVVAKDYPIFVRVWVYSRSTT